MRWALTEEQQMFQETFRDWLAGEAGPERVRAWQDKGDPTAFEAALAKDGWSGVGLDEDRGGQGGDLLESALAMEELARRAAPGDAFLGSTLGIPMVSGDWSDPVLDGAGRVALVVPADRPLDEEPTVVVDGAGRLSGRVAVALGADRAETLIVPARTPDGGVELVLVDAGSPGVHVERRRLLDRSRSAGAVTLDGAVGSRADGDAAALLAESSLRAAVLIAADALGAMATVLDLAVTYAGQRQQFGVPIGTFQAVKHAAAGMLVDVEAARSVVYFAAASVAAGHHDRALHAAVAKAQVVAAGARAADTALTLHGAIGYTWEHDLQLFYKRLKADEFLFGGVGRWNERIADALRLTPATA